MTGKPDIAQLRHLLFGKDYEDLLALKTQFEQSEQYTARVADVITEALLQREAKDQSLSKLLAPGVEQALTEAINTHPKRFADVLYPVMGPAIRKSIQQALNEALENFNRLLEQSVSPRSWRWRLDAWRTGQSYAQVALLNTLVYQVEQVFLIHRSNGLLLQHVMANNAISKDPEIVSGMLTAIQDFIADSFSVTDADSLRTLSLGDLSVWIEQGPHAVLAMVVRGTPPSSLRTHLQSLSESIHRQYAQQFKHYQGDTHTFATTEPLLRHCLVQQQATRQRSPWLAYAVLSLVTAGVGYTSYQRYQQQTGQQQQFQQVLTTLKAEPGLVLIETQTNAQGYHLKGLIDPLARAPTDIIPATLQRELGLSFEFKPYWSLEPAFVQARATTSDTQTRQQQAITQQQIRELTQQVTNASYAFAINGAQVTPNDTLTQLSQTLQQFISVAKRDNKLLQVTIVGNTDEVGTNDFNHKLANARAQAVRDALIALGVPAFILQTQAAIKPPRERAVHYQVALY